MKQLLKQFQGTIFEMYINGRLSEDDFNILSALSEGMDSNAYAAELAVKVTPEDLQNKDFADCILAKQFKTALLIIE